VALDRSGNLVGAGDFKAQTRQVLENLGAALSAAGATFSNIVKVTTFVTDISQIQILRELRSQYFGMNPPASTLVQIVQLAKPEFMIEIEAIAVVAD
jgi:enamine deaminase RidA (YjgF/YER057c/UK114 family)